MKVEDRESDKKLSLFLYNQTMRKLLFIISCILAGLLILSKQVDYIHPMYETCIYYGILASFAIILRLYLDHKKIEAGEWFRKLLHTIQFCSIFPLVLCSPNWQSAVFTELLLVILIDILLNIVERIKPGLFGHLINERQNGEGLNSLFYTFLTIAFVMFLLWDNKPFIFISIVVWGFSDRAAALVGKKYGKHKLFYLKESPKSLEGTSANFMVSFVISFLLLIIHYPLIQTLLFSIVLAFVSSFVESISTNGNDTFTVPISLAFTSLLLIRLNMDTHFIFTFIICLLAGLGAGLSTGLCGLSAAAVIVPMLFSFLDVNAYQATAVALAADVLASLTSAIIYAKHKHINLKYGTIMLISISIMTIVGSLLAHQVGNFALGSISIFVTFCLGVKFIIKPIKEHTFAPEGKEEKKKIIESLVCGIGIGGLCGFVGTGGGTLMLIVLTSVIGFDLKMAVGTSVYIMTVTAFIGATTHIVVAGIPDLTITILTILFTWIFAQVGAIFANRVSGEKMNRSCGIILMVLGIAMMIMKFIM